MVPRNSGAVYVCVHLVPRFGFLPPRSLADDRQKNVYLSFSLPQPKQRIIIVLPGICLGWVGVGWRRRYKKTPITTWARQPGYHLFYFILFGGHHGWRLSYVILCAGRTFPPRKGDDRIT